jgi:hypothetical protein
MALQPWKAWWIIYSVVYSQPRGGELSQARVTQIFHAREMDRLSLTRVAEVAMSSGEGVRDVTRQGRQDRRAGFERARGARFVSPLQARNGHQLHLDSTGTTARPLHTGR